MSPLFALSSLSCSLRLVPAAAALAVLLSACGGGGEAEAPAAATATATATAPTATPASSTFPTGLVVASPADLSQDALSRVAPQSTSSAAVLQSSGIGPRRAEVTDMAGRIETVLSGSGTGAATLAGMADFTALFQVGGHAGCYGPAMLYANHEDGSVLANGQLPAGDTALWQPADAATGQPCLVAELRERTAGVKLQTRQGLLLMAALRAAMATSSAAPAAGGSVDVTRAFTAMAGAVPALSGVGIGAASAALDAQGRTYTYRITLSQGSGSQARSGEIVMTHTPGADANAYSGVLRVAGFELAASDDEGCSDLMNGSRYQVARVTTVRYQRAGNQIDFGARSGRYCGAPARLADADHAGQVASFTADGQLDPAVRLAAGQPGSPVAASGLRGWRGDFDRFGGHYEASTGAGQFLHAWQAGTADTHARVLAASAAYNGSTDERTLQGYFAFGPDIATTDSQGQGQMLGMVCNWSGPGNTHMPVPLFQSQTATLSSLAGAFTATSSQLSHAPTRSCSSISTLFDANADGVLTPGEGLGARQGLDEPAVGRTVQQEIVSRGYAQPALF